MTMCLQNLNSIANVVNYFSFNNIEFKNSTFCSPWIYNVSNKTKLYLDLKIKQVFLTPNVNVCPIALVNKNHRMGEDTNETICQAFSLLLIFKDNLYQTSFKRS